jgi:uncharacterized membrane protein YbhN (UPF0104 family)
MKKRSVVAVLINCLWTCGIFSLLWFIQTKRDLNDRGEKIPTAWWLIVPGANFWWQWKYSEAFARVTQSTGTHKRLPSGAVFVLQLVMWVFAPAILQDVMNAAVDAEDHTGVPTARVVS